MYMYMYVWYMYHIPLVVGSLAIKALLGNGQQTLMKEFDCC